MIHWRQTIGSQNQLNHIQNKFAGVKSFMYTMNKLLIDGRQELFQCIESKEKREDSEKCELNNFSSINQYTYRIPWDH